MPMGYDAEVVVTGKRVLVNEVCHAAWVTPDFAKGAQPRL